MMSDRQVRNKIFSCLDNISHEIILTGEYFKCNTCRYKASKKHGMYLEYETF